MFQLVYASTAARPMPPEDLRALLQAARPKNERLGVTGMLLYRDARFLQALEGEEQTVRGLYDTIRADERHTAVIALRERLVDARDFPDWTMGFTNLDRTDPEDAPEGYASYLNGAFTPDHFRKNPGQVHEALVQFWKAARP
jgi:hypothetical protein